MARPTQGDLFGEPGKPRSAVVSVRIDGGGARLSPLQLEFNRLSAQVEKLRSELVEWQQFSQQLESRMAAATPQIEADTELARRALLVALESILGQTQRPPLSKRARRVLTGYLLDLVGLLIELHPDDAALVVLHDLYSEQPWAELLAEQQQQQRAELEFAEAMAAEAFGEEVVQDHGGGSIEALFGAVEERIRAQLERDAEARQASRRGRAEARRAAQAEQAQAERSKDIRQSVREVYRQLASALHPDRETDPLQRERKTVLMQRINQAYAGNDLLALLALQMEVEQIDDDVLAALPDRRLLHYLDVLKEQSRTLRADIQTWVDEFRARCGNSRLRSRKDFERDLEQALSQQRQHHQALLQWSRCLSEPRLRAAVIDQMEAQARADAFHAEAQQAQAEAELEMLVGFAQAKRGGPTGPRRRKR